METIKTSDDFVHPEGKIQLLNGTLLDCYPLEQTEEMVDNELKLDTTGTYFILGKPKPVAAPNKDEQKEKDEKLFLDNAFLFLQHRDRIMSDSRMFLCPVPIQNGLMYTGTSGFYRPTLGIYLEWWLHCENAMVRMEDKSKWLAYHLAGSPMSGSNRCGIVNKEGKTLTTQLHSFLSLWSSFMEINNRYDEAKSLYQAFTLEEVVETLEREGLTTVDDKDIQILFLDSEICRLNKKITNTTMCLEKKIKKLKLQLMNSYKDKLEALMKEYKEKQEQVQRKEKAIDEECQDLSHKLKLGLIDNKQYQSQLTPLKNEKTENDFQLYSFGRRALDKLFPDLDITINDVEQFLEDPETYKSEKPV